MFFPTCSPLFDVLHAVLTFCGVIIKYSMTFFHRYHRPTANKTLNKVLTSPTFLVEKKSANLTQNSGQVVLAHTCCMINPPLHCVIYLRSQTSLSLQMFWCVYCPCRANWVRNTNELLLLANYCISRFHSSAFTICVQTADLSHYLLLLLHLTSRRCCCHYVSLKN